MNLIDRDKLINAIKDKCPIYLHFDLYETISRQPTVNEWVPVSEPPKECGWYLTVVPNIHINYYYMTCKYDGKFPSDVIAWTSIPTYEVGND